MRASVSVLAILAATSAARAACDVTAAGSVTCQDTITDDTTNTDGASTTSRSRTQLFSNGSSIVGNIAPGVTIGGAGLALKQGHGRRQTPQPITITNNGTVAAQSEGTMAGIRLVGSGAPISYSGSGSVSNGIGFALSASSFGNITIIADGKIAAGTRLSTSKGNRDNTPPGIKAIEFGTGDIVLGGSGTVTADNGRGMWADEQHNGIGNILITGTGDVSTRGLICPGKGDFAHDLAKGKIGCSAVRATIDNPANPGDIVVNRSGNLTGTSAGINTITHGDGNTFVTTGPTARIVGAAEFGLESMSSGTGSITITTAANGSVTSGGDGIFAVNLASSLHARAHSTITINSFGSISSGTFLPATRDNTNPTGVLAGISAGYVGGPKAQRNAAVHGTVDINNAATIDATTGDGILSYNFGNGSINVRTIASVTARAGDGIATLAQASQTHISVLGTGTTIIGIGEGHAALYAKTTRGPVDIMIGRQTTLQGIGGAAGIRMRRQGTISNAGTIVGGRSAPEATKTARLDGAGIIASGLTLANSGAIMGGVAAGSSQAYALVLTGGLDSVGGPGSISGGIDVLKASTFMPHLPGSAVGPPLAISGPLKFASTATYKIHVTPAMSDQIVVAGIATLGHAGVRVETNGASPRPGTRNAILTATNGFVGRFSGVTTNIAFARPTLIYGATNVFLTWHYDDIVPGGTANEMSVGAGLRGTNGQPRTAAGRQILEALRQVETPEGPAVLDSLSGEGIIAARTTAQRSDQLFTSAIFDEMAFNGLAGTGNDITLADGYHPIRELADPPGASPSPALEPMRTWRAWGSGFGGVEDIQGSGTIGSAAQNSAIYGGALGVDYQLTAHDLAGVAVGGTDGAFSVPGRSTSGTTTGGHIAVYDIATFGAFYGAASNSFSYYTNSTIRTTGAFGGLATETERGIFGSREVRTRLEVGRHFDRRGVSITPFVALELAELRSDGFTERAMSGPGLLALNVSGQSSASVPSFIGARFQQVTLLGSGMTFSPSLQLAYVHEFAPRRTQIGTLVDLPGSTFLVDGARPSRDAGQVKIGGALTLNANASLFAAFDGDISGVDQFYGGKGGFRYVW